jgi:hypothetical protein
MIVSEEFEPGHQGHAFMGTAYSESLVRTAITNFEIERGSFVTLAQLEEIDA